MNLPHELRRQLTSHAFEFRAKRGVPIKSLNSAPQPFYFRLNMAGNLVKSLLLDQRRSPALHGPDAIELAGKGFCNSRVSCGILVCHHTEHLATRLTEKRCGRKPWVSLAFRQVPINASMTLQLGHEFPARLHGRPGLERMLGTASGTKALAGNGILRKIAHSRRLCLKDFEE